MTVVSFDLAALQGIFPMMILFDHDCAVTAVGPTLERMAPGALGQSLRDVLGFVHPPVVPDAKGIFDTKGRRLRVQLLAETNVPEGEDPVILRAVVIPLTDGRGMVKLTFGPDPALALRRHRLTARDFAVTDPMVDYLYLIEVHGLLHSEYERLSDRLDLARDAAERAAVTDKLTGLHNRRAMDAHLTNLTTSAVRPFGLMQLDLDYFKAVNDTYGHVAGDRVLEEVAGILREEVRAEDMVARMGGDEFMLVFDNCTDVDLMCRISDRIIGRLEKPIAWEGHSCRISGSIGITMSSYYDQPDPDRLVSDVDAALYAAKRAGRARTTVFDPQSPPDDVEAVG
ncbi:GGDEF domain-containing protein [Jannaschia donghaensis]|uniref:Putative diguanylate cyclase YedQ n=1 Tax=Jannaschia donghaensis TaxID=420998 RepID=A0A0M6YK43_9RHOB|nr:GGDEF domain-containing protein [Jannaschia donghaensis]CTQ50320.1 putative diguanylate cyclase YedQ [Jannaschia donghaensis]